MARPAAGLRRNRRSGSLRGLHVGLLFRGLLQSVAIDVFRSSRAGLAYAGVMSASMYLGTGSLPYTVLVGAFGLLLGVAIVRGASVRGATASHSLAVGGMAVVWPNLLGPA